jgi:rod shape-determining protein MreC
MRRNNRLKTLGILILIAAAMSLVRIGPWRSGFEQATALVAGLAGRAVEHTLLPYGDKEELKIQAARDRERAMRLLRENQHLKQEIRRLGFIKAVRPAPGAVVARVTMRDPSAWHHSVVVDAGASQGVKAGWIASTESGVAGRVTRCAATTCTVRLIVDPDSATTCVIHPASGATKTAEEADFFCMAYGAGARGLDILVVSSSRTARRGDLVVTSGYGGHYPRGLPLGKVSGRAKSGAHADQGFSVKPYADFKNLEYLLLSSQ